MLEILSVMRLVSRYLGDWVGWVGTYARTLEKSAEGDMTKLSEELDHAIKCCMLGSSNILRQVSH